MIVVADSGPLHYLVLLELIERLTNTTFYMDEALVKSVFAPWLEP
jgi:hypothetical protein